VEGTVILSSDVHSKGTVILNVAKGVVKNLNDFGSVP
jgi:hypothetical protein